MSFCNVQEMQAAEVVKHVEFALQVGN